MRFLAHTFALLSISSLAFTVERRIGREDVTTAYPAELADEYRSTLALLESDLLSEGSWLALGGASLLLGVATGAVLVRSGPARSLNSPFVLFGRARLRVAGGGSLARAEAAQALAGSVSAILAADDPESAESGSRPPRPGYLLE